ncbi:unnamed protein product [Adineta steineri]|uniref:Uncharacterized protein n=1 Tax=Adineta steineri TaxID=433720 RepID=A0A815EZB8_9BILA|nr:unnamed protein product [Adineta steineri]CAF1318650.1 unnamed protein product [Adineta steineri]
MIFYAAMMQTESSTVTESNITPVKFKELYSKYNKTLSCPCSTTSITYKNFVSNTIKLHPVCSSRFVSQEWIHALYLSNASRYGVSDFRTTASSQFEILSSFCSLAQDIVNHTKNDVGSNEFVTIYLLPDKQVEHEVNTIIESYKKGASARMITFLDYFRSTIRANYLISALNTNLLVTLVHHLIAGTMFSLLSTEYTHASGDILTCGTHNLFIAATLNPVIDESNSVFGRFHFKNLPNSTIVSGFFGACIPLEALLQSTLDCLYEIECLELLSDYFPSLNDLHINWTNSTLISKQQNLSFNDYLNDLLIDEWLPKPNYSKYFDHCNPSFCTYTKTHQAEFIYAITLFISLYGGLVMILRLMASFIMNISLKVSFILPGIQINSTSINCVCATNPDCQTAAVVYNDNIIHKIPGFIRGCLASDSLLGSTLQCLYSESNSGSDCFVNLLTYSSNSDWTLKLNGPMFDLRPLVYDSERSRFPPTTLISSIIKEMMVEQWNSTPSYEQFYESCAPKYCTYHQKIRTKTIVGIFMTLLSTIGGLAASLHLITPYFIKFLFKLWAMIRKRKQEQQEQQQGNH